MVNLLVIRDFLDAATREAITSEMRLAEGDPATIYGKEAVGAVESRVRKTTRLAVSPQARERIIRLLMNQKSTIEEHFGIDINECEEPQFLRYEAGDFFVAHQDGNTPLILDESRFRKISVIIFLSRQSAQISPDAYSGGSLVFHASNFDPALRTQMAGEPGTLVAFRAETTHEVLPVMHGERYTIVSWYR
jgi:SM-20-related protein